MKEIPLRETSHIATPKKNSTHRLTMGNKPHHEQDPRRSGSGQPHNHPLIEPSTPPSSSSINNNPFDQSPSSPTHHMALNDEDPSGALSMAQYSSVMDSLDKYKVLFLGAGSTGKSTFLKAIEAVKNGKYREVQSKKGIIYFNIIREVGLLCKDYVKISNDFYNSNNNGDEKIQAILVKDLPTNIKEAMDRIVKLATSKSFLQSSIPRSSSKKYNPTFDQHFGEQVFEDVELLWKFKPFRDFSRFHVNHLFMPCPAMITPCDDEANFQKVEFMSRLRSNDYDDIVYFLDNRMHDLYPPYQYEPTQEDILLRRQKTIGLYYMQYIEDVCNDKGFKETRNYLLIDSGGQRSERKKWQPVFNNTFAVFYFVGLSDINLTLYEDNLENRMAESLIVFESICNEPSLMHAPIFLFFTKTDVLKEKIKYGLKPIEFFENILTFYPELQHKPQQLDNAKDSTNTTPSFNTTEPSMTEQADLSVLLTSEQVENIFEQSIDYFTLKFKERLPKDDKDRTIRTFALNATNTSEFTPIFKTVIAELNHQVRHESLAASNE